MLDLQLRNARHSDGRRDSLDGSHDCAEKLCKIARRLRDFALFIEHEASQGHAVGVQVGHVALNYR